MVQGVDYRVPLSAQGLDLNGAIDNYYKYQQNKRQNALLDLTSRQKEQEMAHLDDESRIKSMARFALEIKPLAEAGDMAGLQRAYNRRIGEIKSRNGNPSDSMEIAPYLMSGDTESIKQMADGVINLGRELGYLMGGVPKADGGFTLKEGDTRFDSNGSILASVPKAKEPADRFDPETKLRNEYTGFAKDYQKQNAAFGRIQAAANDPTPAGDLALIFNYMKLLDPGSTVREGEFATAQGAMAALGRAIGS